MYPTLSVAVFTMMSITKSMKTSTLMISVSCTVSVWATRECNVPTTHVQMKQNVASKMARGHVMHCSPLNVQSWVADTSEAMMDKALTLILEAAVIFYPKFVKRKSLTSQ